MSVIKDSKNDVNLNRIPSRLIEYNALIDAAEAMFVLEGQSLEQLCKNHAQDLMSYDVILQECKTIEEAVRTRVEEIESECYKNLNENNPRSLGQRDITQYIKSEPRYIAAYEILLEIILVKRKLEAIVEALKSLGWSLNNIVKLRIAQLEHVTL